MNTFFADLMNGFALSDIPLLFVQLFSAGLLSLIGNSIITSKSDSKNHVFIILLSICIALLTVFAKNDIQIAVIFLGVCFIVGNLFRGIGSEENLLKIILPVVAGVCMGAGFVAITWLVFILIVFPILFYKNK